MAGFATMGSMGHSSGATALASAAAKLQARGPGSRARRSRRRIPALFLVTDDDRLADPLAAVRRLPRGAAVIARARDATELSQLVAALAPVCRRRGVALIVANDIRLALRYGAAGVHVSERGCRRRSVAALGLAQKGPRGRRFLVTAAAHSLPAMLRAQRLGAAVVVLSPAFPTQSHPGVRPLGAVRFAALIRAARRKGLRAAVVALGGVTAATAQRLAQAGAGGLAAVGALAVGPRVDSR